MAPSLWLLVPAVVSQVLCPSFGQIWPSLQWDARNPTFRSNTRINVLPSSKIMIVCPNPTTVLVPMASGLPKQQLFENLWIVDKGAFDTCSVDTSKQENKLLMQCNTPLELKYFTIVFQAFSAIAGGLEFQPGTEYYFIATSDGTDVSVTSQSGGHCKTHNMKVTFYVCMSDQDPQCKDILPASSVRPTSATVYPTNILPSPTVTKPVPQCSAVGTPTEFREILNNTRRLPKIYNHTEQISDIFAQLQNLSMELGSVREKLSNCGSGATKPPSNLKNCQELYNAGFTVSGIYTITPGDGQGPFQVLCDQFTAGGGWTVIQKRFDGSVLFNRSWAEYEVGFGKLDGEFWLGLEKIHRLATGNPGPTLRFDLGAPDGTTKYEEYKNFTVTDATSKYKVHVGAATGTALDSFSFQNEQKFSTYDQDNDQWNGNCAQTFPSGWWHKACHQSGMNGLYSKNPTIPFGNGIIWFKWKGYKYGLSKTEMKVRP